MKLDSSSRPPRRSPGRPGGSSRTRSRRQWLAIIAVAVIAHLLLLIFFKVEYLEIFRADIRGDEGATDYVPFDRPFSLIPYPQLTEPFDPAAPTAEPTDETEEDVPVVPHRIGEPSLDVELPRGVAARTGDGRPGPRRTTVEPKPLFIPWPAYPRDAPENIRGTVELLVYVNERGTVDEIKVARGLPHESFNRTAVEAARRMRFMPGEKEGAPTAMWVRLSIGFQPR